MKKLSFILVLFLLSCMVWGQGDASSRMKDFMYNIHSFNRLYPQEKVWLHCDNTAYFQGDTIWFSAYVTSAETLRPIELSKVLYVELLNEVGEVVSTQRLQVENGRCHGQISLNTELERKLVRDLKQDFSFPINPVTKSYYMPLPSGYYEIRAYTRAMLNWGTDVCFSRIFPVFDTPKREGDYSQLTMDNREKKQRELIEDRIRLKTSEEEWLNVCFYPEGGDIVNGLPCRVAYKVTDKEGHDLVAKCQLLADEEIITEARTIHDGMGHFSFFPQEGVKYKLSVNTGERVRTFALPNARSQGLMLTVDAIKEDSIRMAVAVTDSLRHKTIGISITCRGKLLHFNVYNGISKRPVRLPAIAKNRLSPGVNQLTLFDADGQVYAERLFFVHDTAVVGKCPVEYRLDKNEYKPFEKINLTISTLPHREGWGGSLSVRDGSTEIGTPYTDNLQTYLLLTSDLKGYIHRPDYYFEADDSVHRTALDLLMMTQGWRRYAWKQLAGLTEFQKTHFVEEGLTLQGQVKHPKRKNSYLSGIRVSAIVSKGKEVIQEGYMATDEKGRFTFAMMPFIGKNNLDINLTDKNNKLTDGQILLHRHFSPQPRECQIIEKEIWSIPQPPQIRIDSFSFSGSNLLGEIQISQNRHQFEPFTLHDIKKEREKSLDIGCDDFLTNTIEGYIMDKYDSFDDEISWSFVGKSSEKEILAKRSDLIFGVQGVELRFVDYINVYHYNTAHQRLKWVTPLPIEKQNKRYKSISALIYRKPKEVKGMRRTHIDGYSEVIDYYHPQYDREIIPGEVDYRRTLYWNPYLEFDEEGKVNVMFYNNGICKELKIDLNILIDKL